MGHSIALSAVWAGYKVKMQGIDQADVERGLGSMQEKLQVLIDNGLIDEAEANHIQSRVTTTTSIEAAVNGSTFIIEAVPEHIELKKQLFNQLDQLCEPTV